MSWERTRTIYGTMARDVMDGKRALLKEAPQHVPVLARDLDYMCSELKELDQLRAWFAAHTEHITAGTERDHAAQERLERSMRMWARRALETPGLVDKLAEGTVARLRELGIPARDVEEARQRVHASILGTLKELLP